jgi:hypothetical protein
MRVLVLGIDAGNRGFICEFFGSYGDDIYEIASYRQLVLTSGGRSDLLIVPGQLNNQPTVEILNLLTQHGPASTMLVAPVTSAADIVRIEDYGALAGSFLDRKLLRRARADALKYRRAHPVRVTSEDVPAGAWQHLRRPTRSASLVPHVTRGVGLDWQPLAAARSMVEDRSRVRF